MAVKNWLDYHWLESSGSALTLTKKKIAQDPIATFLQQLTMKEPTRQRVLMAQQLWSKEHLVGPMKMRFELEFRVLNKPKNHHATAQADFVAKRFEELTQEDQKVWKAKAQKDVDAVKQGKEEVIPGPSLLPPEEAQKALDNIRAILVPLAEGIAKSLGMQVHIVLAGPEPRMGGQLNIIGIHEGHDKSAIPRRFDKAGGEHGVERYKLFLAALGDYLVTCYSEEEQCAHVLSSVPFPATPPGFLHVDSGIAEGSSLGGKRGRDELSDDEDEDEDDEQSPEKKKKKTGRKKVPTVKGAKTKPSKGKPAKTKPMAKENGVLAGREHLMTGFIAVPGVTDKASPPQKCLDGLHGVLDDITNTIQLQALTPDQVSQIDPSLLVQGALLGTFIPNCGPNDCPNPFAPLPPSSPTLPSTGPILPQVQEQCSPMPEYMDAVNWVPWFRQARQYLSQFKLGKEWDELLLTFMVLEGRHGFASGGKAFKPEGRPAVIGMWIQNAQNRDLKKLSPIAAYSAGWWAWWRHLQPEWRDLPGEGAFQGNGIIVENSWPELNNPRSRVNGMYSVIAGLAWWGAAVKDDAGLRATWGMAVADVKWAIVALSA